MATFFDKIHDFCDWAIATPGYDAIDIFANQPWYGYVFGICVLGLIVGFFGLLFVTSLFMFREVFTNIGYNPTRAAQCWAVGIFLFLGSWLAFTFFLNMTLIGLFGLEWKGIYLVHYAKP
ncbi:MAG: hypothetical protein EP315_05980 [Gammaproteobacteria bacterium]|nr:MAG: hypothetical protein EP315_05980 [Gammaproteobacteria bacterium]TNG03007.1 MAG: hypothetical protein EP297_00640 [Gammaproteobacteria bacterium]